MKNAARAPMPFEDILDGGVNIKKGQWRAALLYAGSLLQDHGLEYECRPREHLMVKAAVKFWKLLFAGNDIAFYKELADRMDGKPAQAVHVGDANGEPIPYQIIRFADLPLAGSQDDASPKRLDS